MKDLSLCRECQSRPIEYTTSITGCKLKHGVCRDCYERRAARNPRGFHPKPKRNRDQAEDTRETKYGVDR